MRLDLCRRRGVIENDQERKEDSMRHPKYGTPPFHTIWTFSNEFLTMCGCHRVTYLAISSLISMTCYLLLPIHRFNGGSTLHSSLQSSKEIFAELNSEGLATPYCPIIITIQFNVTKPVMLFFFKWNLYKQLPGANEQLP